MRARASSAVWDPSTSVDHADMACRGRRCALRSCLGPVTLCGDGLGRAERCRQRALAQVEARRRASPTTHHDRGFGDLRGSCTEKRSRTKIREVLIRGLSNGGLPRSHCWLRWQVETDSDALARVMDRLPSFGAAQADGSRAGQFRHDGGLVGRELAPAEAEGHVDQRQWRWIAWPERAWRSAQPSSRLTCLQSCSVQPCAARTSDDPGHVGGRQRAVLWGAHRGSGG